MDFLFYSWFFSVSFLGTIEFSAIYRILIPFKINSVTHSLSFKLSFIVSALSPS